MGLIHCKFEFIIEMSLFERVLGYILLCAIILSLKTFKVISMLYFLSSALMSATNQVYQSLAKLIRLCDDVLLFGDKAISQENVTEVVKLVEDAVQVLPYTFI